MNVIYTIATLHSNVQKLKTSEDTWVAVVFLILVFEIVFQYLCKMVWNMNSLSILICYVFPTIKQSSYFKMQEHAKQRRMSLTSLTQLTVPHEVISHNKRQSHQTSSPGAVHEWIAFPSGDTRQATDAHTAVFTSSRPCHRQHFNVQLFELNLLSRLSGRIVGKQISSIWIVDEGAGHCYQFSDLPGNMFWTSAPELLPQACWSPLVSFIPLLSFPSLLFRTFYLIFTHFLSF